MAIASLPPGPTAPRAVQTWNYMRRPVAFLEDCRARYGDIFTIRLAGLGEWVYLATPELVQAMFTGPPETHEAGVVNGRVFGAIAGSQTVFTMDGSAHLHQRRLVLPPFHGQRVAAYLDAMRDIAEAMVAHWPEDTPIKAHREMQQAALEVIIRTVFGVASADDRLAEILVRLANGAVGSPLLLIPMLQRDLGAWSPWGRVLAMVREADDAIFAEIGRRRANGGKGEDIMAMLLAAEDEVGNRLTDRQVRDELVTLLMAGHETTATALAWVLAELATRPETVSRIQDELREIVGDEPLGPRHIDRLDYLDAVIKEVMRLRPIAINLAARRLAAPTEYAGYELPEGTIVTNAIWLLHRRPELYDDPETFRPERFLGVRPNPFTWTPFGGGVRRCIGMAFALYEMKVILATVLRRRTLALAGAAPKPVRRGFFLVPAGGAEILAPMA